jgi:nitrile hydratase subunit beta
MDGVHDLGGREGFGPIVDKADDKPFHADWEMRAFGMKQASAAAKSWTIDWFRHSRELTDPVDYLTRPYFDQWLTTLAAQMIDEAISRSTRSRRAPRRLRRSPAFRRNRRTRRAPMSRGREVSRLASTWPRASRWARLFGVGSTAARAIRVCPDMCGAGQG